MYNEDLIESIADSFREQWEDIYYSYLGGTILIKRAGYEAQLKDDIYVVAQAILKCNPTYNIDDFYIRCGYPEGNSAHQMRRFC